MTRARSMTPLLALLLIGGCGDGQAKVDQSTIDRGAFRDPGAPPGQSPTTLASGATVLATPAAKDLQDYLNSDSPAGRVFPLPSVGFVGGEQVRQDPNGAVATIAAVLRAHPEAGVRIEVLRNNAGEPAASPAMARRAERVAKVFVENGVPPDRISSAAVEAPVEGGPVVQLVVVRKR